MKFMKMMNLLRKKLFNYYISIDIHNILINIWNYKIIISFIDFTFNQM